MMNLQQTELGGGAVSERKQEETKPKARVEGLLVDDCVHSYRPAESDETGVVWVGEDEVVRIEASESVPSDAARHGWDMIHTGFLDHRLPGQRGGVVS